MEPKLSRNKTVQKLLDINKENSEAFIDAQRTRQIYRVQHPTEIAVMKCMDGRVNVPVITETPLGIAQPWRTIGGEFDLGWPHYKETIEEWSDYAIGRGRKAVVFTTYHFARGGEGEDPEKVKYRGCAGFLYNTENARNASLRLKQQFDEAFRNDGLYAFQCGVETDLEALVLHGNDGKQVDLATVDISTEAEALDLLSSLRPDIPVEVLSDLVPLVLGNIRHTKSLKESGRPVIDLEHKEQAIAVGRGFDWLHTPNFALIIGPYSPNFSEAIAKAAEKVLKTNIEEKRIDLSEGLALLVSTPYRKEGYKQRLAMIKAEYLTKVAEDIIKKTVPDLWLHFQVVTATCDMNTRQLHLQ